MEVTVLIFAVDLQKVRTKCFFFSIFERGLGRVPK